MLAGDYQCYAYQAPNRGLYPTCKICHSLCHHPAPAEDLVYILTRCRATADTCSRYLPELLNTVERYFPTCNLLFNTTHDTQLTFDCSSLNLAPDKRIPSTHPNFTCITRQYSVMIHSIHGHRTRLLNYLGILRA